MSEQVLVDRADLETIMRYVFSAKTEGEETARAYFRLKDTLDAATPSEEADGETATDEMVEAAARALYERTFEPRAGATPWDKARDLWRDQYRASARAMLGAALVNPVEGGEGNE